MTFGPYWKVPICVLCRVGHAWTVDAGSALMCIGTGVGKPVPKKMHYATLTGEAVQDTTSVVLSSLGACNFSCKISIVQHVY